uniref:Protein translocase subunit SecA 2 n=3 Tax=Culex pipiens TaxID=7175 RepID=A0A8D8K9J2_CULPI
MVESAPECLQNFLRSACEKRIALISGEDIKLFMNMCTFLNKDIFEKPLKDLTICWINLMNSVKINETKEVVRFTQPIYFFLCKSLEEVIIEISNKTGIEKSKLLISDNNGWYANKTITWKQDNSLSRCLEHEYNFIFKLLKHFELTNRAIRPFNYSVVLLNRQKTSAYGNFIESAKRMFFNKSKNHLEVSDDVYIWYCMLDEVLSNVLPFASLKHGGELDLFRNILQKYTKLVREAGHDQLETVRVISHSLGRFIVQAIQLLKQDGNSDIEQRVLRGQLDVNSRVGFKSSNYFRDFINVFSDFWRCRNEVIALLPSKMNLPEMDIICNKLVEIIAVALGKKVDAGEMVNFFRVFNDFIIDLGEVQFDWFIKNETVQKNNVDSSVLSMIDNKWKNSDNATYRVIKIEEFLNFFDSPPNHYVIDIIDKLLSTIMIQMNRKDWGPNQDLSETDQVATTSSLISAIRSTLIYLDEQPDYVSFDRFLEERVNPFVSVVENSTNYSEFFSRISLIKESFWYIRKQNEMSIDYALEMFDNLNENVDKNLLQKSYDIYCDRFDKIMAITMGKQHTEKISFITQKKLKSVQQIHFKHWSQRFKQHTLPTILAKLAAIWSIQVSKDVSSTVGFFKPHCIQVLCVLRMLSADQIKVGVEKHFAQVLTGQGKSLVLALTAAILALTGHKVDLVCYNTYLVQKDETEFEDFFKTLKVNENIEYKTFDNMANTLITSDINGERVGLRELVNNMILGKPQPPFMTKDNGMENSVLLIDEADVFFTEDFYGKSYEPAVFPVIPGLTTIQEYIWNAINSNLSLADVQRRTQEFMDSDAFENRAEFNQFRTDKMKELLETIDGNLTRKTYTNKTLLNKHLQRMITCAWEVKHTHSASVLSGFKLSDNKTICMKDETGEFSHTCFCNYYLVFNYMRLKETNFVAEIEDVQNFGYLNIECGAISYALLPLNYPLILGVSGTLTDLNFHEKFAIENLYKIKQSSVMPSFFGCSNMCFNEEEDFHCSYAVDEWLNQVYRHTYTKIAKNRAVIIFFEDDEKLEKFRKEYSTQFDRVNVLTVNTKGTERDQFINEAGVAKTVTLASRRMGRGVDFKSSVTVEKNGGVHVIQTFLSSDVKEEIQIKGRTARKDNKGSYELIVCECDLPVVEAETPLFLNYTYKILDNDRKNKSLKTNEKLAAKIKQAQKDHELTMEYMKSFSKEK